MQYTGQFYFLGQYKPLTIQATSIKALRAKMFEAIKNAHNDDWHWYAWRIEECVKELRKGAAAFSCEHGCKGITMKKRPHDPWLESITNTMPEYVGLNY